MSRSIDRRRLLTHGLCLAGGVGLGWLGSRLPVSWPGNLAIAEEKEEETAEQRLRKLKLELPKPSKPRATLVPAVRAGDMLYVSGHGPLGKEGKPFTGKVGKDHLTLEEGQQAARSVGLVVLGVVKAELGSLDKVVRLVKTLGMVNCTPEFTQQAQVINGFSDLMVDVFGDRAGKGARSAVGMVALPGGIPVEIECIFQVKS